MRARLLIGFFLLWAGCPGQADSTGYPLKDGSVGHSDATGGKKDGKAHPAADGSWANDPSTPYCGPDGGGTAPLPPGGTAECPADKNREGCPCVNPGEQAACWPGLRINRNRGLCQDGVTTCIATGELMGQWGPCKGAVLPTPGATLGPEACQCFSKGQWALDNTTPCFIIYPDNSVWAVSSYLNNVGKAACPAQFSTTPPPQPSPGQPWSFNRLQVDCTGTFKICFTLKAGDVEHPAMADCTLTKVCTEAWYPEANAVQTMPPLPGWASADSTCAGKFDTSGGYGEMSVEGMSSECQDVGDQGQARVFHRVKYCPTICSESPSAPGCVDCKRGAGGTF
jgi:hypothetical protein